MRSAYLPTSRLALCFCWLIPLSTARGQVLQLPTFDWFSVNTSVMVPDRGGAYLGGVGRSQLGSIQRGTPLSRVPYLGPLAGSRALGGGTSSSGSSVHVTIIDHAEWDRAVLEEARRRRAGADTTGTLSPALADFSADLRASAASQPQGSLLSVAEIQRRNAQQQSRQQREAERYLAQGLQAQRQGSWGAAKIYLQMALRRAEGDLEQEIAGHLVQVTRQQAAERTATRAARSKPQPDSH